jgi:hypothetical protein
MERIRCAAGAAHAKDESGFFLRKRSGQAGSRGRLQRALVDTRQEHVACGVCTHTRALALTTIRVVGSGKERVPVRGKFDQERSVFVPIIPDDEIVAVGLFGCKSLLGGSSVYSETER